MLATENPYHRERVEFQDRLTLEEIDQLAASSRLRVLQCASPVQPQVWDLLNGEFFIRRSDVELRVYGFFSSTCDLSFVKKLGNVRKFRAGCLMNASGVEHLSSMEHLEELSIGIFSLESFDFLQNVPSGISSLFLLATRSKKPRLAVLNRFRQLRTIYLEGQQNDISVLAQLTELEDVTLQSISTPGLEYLAALPRLWSLDIKLGGIRDLSAIAGKEAIKYLELWQIRGLSDISVVSTLSGLQYLFLQALRNVSRIPDLFKLTDLRRIHLGTMKGLKDVTAITNALALEEFIHLSAQNIRPEQYLHLLQMRTLKSVFIGFGSQQKNQEFEERVIQSGKAVYRSTPFVFQ